MGGSAQKREAHAGQRSTSSAAEGSPVGDHLTGDAADAGLIEAALGATFVGVKVWVDGHILRPAVVFVAPRAGRIIFGGHLI